MVQPQVPNPLKESMRALMPPIDMLHLANDAMCPH